jgi:hypothetical protein
MGLRKPAAALFNPLCETIIEILTTAHADDKAA